MRSISIKLLAAFVVVSISGALLFFGVARTYSNQELEKFLFNQDLSQVTDQFARYYQEFGTWDGIRNLQQQIPAAGGIEGRFPPFILVDADKKVVQGPDNAHGGYKSGEVVPDAVLENAAQISMDGQIIGWLVLPPDGRKDYFPESPIYARINLMLLYSAGGALIVALVLGTVFSRMLSRPLKELSTAAQRAATGDLGQKVEVHSKDEIGLLAESFNQMMEELSQLMASRRQMTADIAHDLRTPISVILGHAEGVHEGVLDPTPERFEIIRDEAVRLERLVQDLRVLSMADVGELTLDFERTAPEWVVDELARTSTTSLSEKSITMTTEVQPGLPEIEVDKDRIMQVFRNVLENAIRFSPAHGQIELSCTLDETGLWVVFRIQDGGPGVAEGEFGKIFDRFYRTDPSRQRGQMGSGLGLAIARSITGQHGGRIRAESAPEGGLVVIIQLPAAGSSPGAAA